MNLRALAVSSVVTLLAACGGGGGNSNGGDSPGLPEDSPILEATGILDAALIVGLDPSASLSEMAEDEASAAGASHALAAPELPRIKFIVPRSLGGHSNSGTGCLSGGTRSAQLADVDASGTLSAGDTHTVVYTNCRFDGATINGTATTTVMTAQNMTLATLRDPTPPYELTVERTQDITMADDGATVRFTGSVTRSVASVDGVTITGSVTTDDVTISVDGDSVTLRNFDVDATLDNNTEELTVTIATTIDTNFAGSATIETLQALVFEDAHSSDHPSAGQVRLTTPEAILVLTAQPTMVEVTVDSNKDGIVDETLTATWEQVEVSEDHE